MITCEEVKALLHYDELTGVFKWKAKKRGPQRNEAGNTMNNGYKRIRIKCKQYLAHRIAWLYVYGEFPKDEIDHINHDTMDNSIANLREATRIENNKNQPMRKDNTSGIVGVIWYKPSNCWRAEIKIKGRKKHLGYYQNIKDANSARKEAEVLYGFHPNHGKKLINRRL